MRRMQRRSSWWLAGIPIGLTINWWLAHFFSPSLDKQVLYTGVLLDVGGLGIAAASLMRLRSIFRPPRSLEGLDVTERTREEFYRERRRQRRAAGARDSAIRELAVGGFYVEMMGLGWIFLGLIFTSIPEEIAAGVKGILGLLD